MDKKQPQADVMPIASDRSQSDIEKDASQSSSSRSDAATDHDYWLWELIGILGSAFAMAGMIGFLYHFNDKKIPEWSMPIKFTTKSIPVTLNSILSILSTISKICVLIPVTKGLGQLKWLWFAKDERALSDMDTFESASRGLSGSALLPWKLRFRHFAALAAMAMLISVAFDPFVQNLIKWGMSRGMPSGHHIKYTQKYSNVSIGADPADNQRSAHVAFATNYSVADGYSYSGGGRLDMRMKSYLDAALANRFEWLEPYYYCSTGDCDFQPFLTLGISHRCTEVTDKLEINCGGEPISETGSVGCNVSLPNGFSLNGPTGSLRNVFALNSNQNASFEPVVYKAQDYPELQIMNTVQSIFSWNKTADAGHKDALAGMVPGYHATEDSGYQAWECVLYPAVQLRYLKINQTIAGTGVQTVGSIPLAQESIIAEYTQYQIDTLDDGEEQITILTPSTKRLEDDIAKFTANVFPRDFEFFTSQIPPKSGGFANPTGPFGMTRRSWSGLSEPVKRSFTGFAHVSHIEEPSMWQFTSTGTDVTADAGPELPDMETLFFGIYAFSQVGHPGGDIGHTLQSVALAMTVSMRFSAASETDDDTGLIMGAAYTYVPWIVIQWYWLVVPIVLWLLSLVILIGTAWKSRRAGVRSLGTSPLPIVFLDVGEQQRKNVEAYSLSEDGYMKTAEGLKLRLKVGAGHLKLVPKEV